MEESEKLMERNKKRGEELQNEITCRSEGVQGLDGTKKMKVMTREDINFWDHVKECNDQMVTTECNKWMI